MDKSAKKLAKQGRHGDTRLAHLTPGEVVVPKSVQPAVLGLLADAFAQNGHRLERYTVGDQASKNPRTGLLEFYDDDNGNDNGDDNGKGAGKAGASGDDGSDGESGWGGRDRNDGGRDNDSFARGFSGTVNGRDAFGNFSGDSLAGSLGIGSTSMSRAVASQPGGWRGSLGLGGTSADRDTPASVGLFGGFVPGTGTFSPRPVSGSYTAQQAINALGFTKDSLPSGMRVGGSLLGAPGSIAGATTDAMRMASAFREAGLPDDQARALAGDIAGRSLMGSSAAGMAAGMLPGPLGMVASYGVKAATASPFGSEKTLDQMASFKPDRPTASGSNDRPTGIAGLMDSPLGRPTPAMASDYGYAPGPVAAVDWSPVQWGTQYDPVRGLLG